MTHEAKLRDDIVSLGKSFYDRGLTHGSTGNISVRIDDGWLLTPTGTSLGLLDPARLSKLDRNGRLVSGDPPTKEVPLHLAVYEERRESHAVVHLHSGHAVGVSVLADVNPENALPPLTAYYVMRVGTLPLIPYFAPGARELGDGVRDVARHHHAMLLANHGPVVAGRSLLEASDAIEELEATAKLYLMLRHEPLHLLSPEQIGQLRPPMRS